MKRYRPDDGTPDPTASPDARKIDLQPNYSLDSKLSWRMRPRPGDMAQSGTVCPTTQTSNTTLAANIEPVVEVRRHT